MPETPVFLINIDNPYLPSSYFKASYEGSFLKDLRTGKYLKFRRRKVSPAVKKDCRIGTGRFYEATFIFRLFFDEYSIADPSVVIRIYLTSKMLQFYKISVIFIRLIFILITSIIQFVLIITNDMGTDTKTTCRLNT